MMQQIKQSYANTPTDKAIRNAIGSNDIRKLALNQDNLKGMDTHFSIKVPSKGITDQKSSGHMPFRAIAKMTGGMVSMEMVEGLLKVVNGHFSGLGKVISGFFRNQKLNKQYEKDLEEQK